MSEKTETIIERHLSRMLDELNEAGVEPFGILAGVLVPGDTFIHWCVSPDLTDESGATVSQEQVAREIAVNMEMATRSLAPS